MHEEKTAVSEPIQTIVPPQEQLFFPTVDPSTEAKVHYAKLRDGIGVQPIPQETPDTPERNDSEKQVKDLVRFLRHIATADEATQREILVKMRGQDDIQLIQISNETTHGLDVDAQEYLNQAQKKAAEREAQVNLATEVTKSPSLWSSVVSRFRKKAA